MIEEAKTYIKQFFDKKQNAYHSMEHTMSVYHTAKLIADKEKIGDTDSKLLLLSALFHDTGYGDSPTDHEAKSAKIAEEYLHEKGLDQDDIEKVKNIILSTKIDVEPTDKLQSIIKDADLAHLGQKCFNQNSLKLKEEREKHTGNKIKAEEWTNNNIKFLKNHEWHTKSARKLFDKKKVKNLKEEKQKLKKIQKKNNPEKGVETMYRVALRNHNQLSKIADNKANILLSITAIMLSLVISNLATKIDSNPKFLIPTILIIAVNIITMFFSILATRPKVSSAPYSREDFLSNKVNILFFGNFYKMTIEEFEWGMKHLQGDRDLLYNSLSKDLYYLGSVLAKKYRYLQIAYAVFMGGLSISTVAFIWTILR